MTEELFTFDEEDWRILRKMRAEQKLTDEELTRMADLHTRLERMLAKARAEGFTEIIAHNPETGETKKLS